MQKYYSCDKNDSEVVGYERSEMQKDIILQRLRNRGCRITKQRMMLLDIIRVCMTILEKFSFCLGWPLSTVPYVRRPCARVAPIADSSGGWLRMGALNFIPIVWSPCRVRIRASSCAAASTGS